jgi:hypothetical protein
MHTLNFDMYVFITSKNGFSVWLYNIAQPLEKKNGGNMDLLRNLWVIGLKSSGFQKLVPTLVKIQNIHLGQIGQWANT